jgi:hypothetical protein
MFPMDDAAASANDGTESFLRLDRAAKQAGASITAALAAGQVEGRKLDDVLRSVGQRLAQSAIQSAGRSLFGSLASTLGSTLVSSVSGGIGGAVGLAAPVTLSGLGDVANSVTPVAAQAVSPAARPISVAMTVNTPDAESFKRSEAQVSAALARAVQRGQRGL